MNININIQILPDKIEINKNKSFDRKNAITKNNNIKKKVSETNGQPISNLNRIIKKLTEYNVE